MYIDSPADPQGSICTSPETTFIHAAMNLLKAFLVEDSPVIRENLICALEELAPIRVVGFAGGEAEALTWLAAHPGDCDLLVVDMFLKQGSGLDVLRAAWRTPAAMRKVVLTNFATPEMRWACLGLGAHRVFDKSNEIDDLIRFCSELATGDAATDARHASS